LQYILQHIPKYKRGHERRRGQNGGPVLCGDVLAAIRASYVNRIVEQNVPVFAHPPLAGER